MTTHSDMWQKFGQSKEYRSAFARTQFKRLVPLQIQTLRKKRSWSQSDLAHHADLTQGVVSRAEDQDYGNLTVNTILKIAEGLDVAFVGRFVPFSELGRWYVNLSQETMKVASFDEENSALHARTREELGSVLLTDENQRSKAVDRFQNREETGIGQAALGRGGDTSAVTSTGGLAYAGTGNSPR